MPSSSLEPYFHWTRRQFLRNTAAAGGLACLPASWSRAAENGVPRLPDAQLILLRDRDLLHLRVRTFGLWSSVTGSGVRTLSAKPPRGATATPTQWVIVDFPPQHTTEHFYVPPRDDQEDDAIARELPLPITAALSGPSRLVFELGPDGPGKEMRDALVGQNLKISYFLAWLARYSHYAASSRDIFDAPIPDLPWNCTSLELPGGLFLSPDPAHPQSWRHRVRAARVNAPNELWHTTLALSAPRPLIGPVLSNASWVKSDRNEGEGLKKLLLSPVVPKSAQPHGVLNATGFRATPIDQDDPKTKLQPPLSFADREKLTSQAKKKIGVLRAEHLSLTARGATAALHYRMDIADLDIFTGNRSVGLNIILEWLHVMILGRDQYVRVVCPGFLLPFQHRAVLVKIGERKPVKEKSPS
ncbi:MAG: twin-arginine translocation signal domain-containing protein, partial [Verrucomicrobia bacterium]|nr:twin-arginine translocation signal domain-containing protein [Verrucomicrobiota bacterium]